MSECTSFARRFLEQSASYQNQYHDYQYPKVSIIIPTYNCAQAISLTLDSILSQNYPELEVLIMDGGSQDRTLEIVKRYRGDRIFLHYEAQAERYALLNKGITLAQGEYVNFLFPGDFYICKETLKQVMAKVLSHQKPDLAYCGTLLRDGRSEVKILFRSLDLSLLRRGQQPTSLQSCWFKTTIFSKLGSFDERLQLRGGFDILCRFCSCKDLTHVGMSNVMTDYDMRWISKSMIIRHFTETGRIICTHFGWAYLIRWLFVQKDIARYLKLWAHGAKIALTGR